LTKSNFHASALKFSAKPKAYCWIVFCLRNFGNSRLTFPRYKQFGTKLSPTFGFAKSSKYKTNFQLSLIPKLLVACVSDSFFTNIHRSYQVNQTLIPLFSQTLWCYQQISLFQYLHYQKLTLF
jgi:hypothetical protein